MNFFKGLLLLLAGFCLAAWLISGWHGGTYCQQKYYGDPPKIKTCEQEAAEAAKKATPEEKAKHKRVLDLIE